MTAHVHHLSATIPRTTPAADLPALVADLLGIHGLDPLAVQQRGRNGYRTCYALRTPAGAELVAILTDGTGHGTGTSHIIIHGAAWEAADLDPRRVAEYIMDRGGWSTEVHLAADDTAGILPWQTIRDMSIREDWDSHISTTLCRRRVSTRTGHTEGDPALVASATGASIYYGTRSSHTSICIYDRRGLIRVEYRTRTRGGATDILRRLADGEDLGAMISGIIRRCLRFHAPGRGRKDRRPVAAWWDDFLGASAPIQLPRHRPSGHRSPWYVPPTLAEKTRRYITRHLTGDPVADAETIDTIRALVADHDRDRQIAETWDSPAVENCPVITSHSFPRTESFQELMTRIEKLQNTYSSFPSPANITGLYDDIDITF